MRQSDLKAMSNDRKDEETLKKEINGEEWSKIIVFAFGLISFEKDIGAKTNRFIATLRASINLH